MNALAAAELFVLALTALAVISRVGWSALAPRLLATVRAWEPARRHLAVLLLCAAPLLTTVALFVTALLPSLLALRDPRLDHCLVHDDHHAHLCFLHLPRHAPHVAIWAALAFVLTLAVIGALSALLRLLRSLATVRALVRTSTRDGQSEACVLDSELPFCATAGLLQPRILISRSLLVQLGETERAALIAHERGHARRRDALVGVIARTLSAVYPRHARASLLCALDIAAEETCDEAAARSIGDRLAVAETIVRVERAMMAAGAARLGPTAVGMGQLGIEQRVASLLGPARVQSHFGALIGVLIAASVALWLSAEHLHHAVESILSPLLG